jgi:hypothetical protein
MAKSQTSHGGGKCLVLLEAVGMMVVSEVHCLARAARTRQAGYAPGL